MDDHRDSYAVSMAHGSIGRSVFLFTAAVSLAAEENGITETHIRKKKGKISLLTCTV